MITRTRRTAKAGLLLSPLLLLLTGCLPQNNLYVNTATGRLVHTGGSVVAPLGAQPVAGHWLSDISGEQYAPFGSTYSFAGVTLAGGQSNLLGVWPTSYEVSNARAPAYWQIGWSHPPSCLDISAPPYGALVNPFIETVDVEPVNGLTSNGPQVNLICYTNTPNNPDFVPTNVSPQFSLDDASPSTLQVASFAPINAAPSITHLRVFATDFSNPSTVTATSVKADGSNAVFPYPRQANGASLPAGAYITTITTDPSGTPQTTNGMEPFYIGHDDKTFSGAYGVAVAFPKETIAYSSSKPVKYLGCGPEGSPITTIVGGTPTPLVTLLNLNELAIGSTSNSISVGTNPTVVIPFNDQTKTSVQTTDSGDGGETGEICTKTTTTYSGAQQALVVNTGSNNISIVNIGSFQGATGMAAVGRQPVAATINATETMAYIANYGDNTVSEVNLATIQQTRTIGVMTHPASLSFDTNGNLWVGGQGSVMNINVGNWSIASTMQVDGTVNGMAYDKQGGVLLQTILQNGSVSSPSNGTTASAPINYQSSTQASYSTQNTFNLVTGRSTILPVAGDNAAYVNSAVARYLAFPGQTAFSPPIFNSTNGDITATVNGTSFTISVVLTGQVLMQGVLPYPARSVALASTVVYFTMPDTNSLVSVPIKLQ